MGTCHHPGRGFQPGQQDRIMADASASAQTTQWSSSGLASGTRSTLTTAGVSGSAPLSARAARSRWSRSRP